MPSAASFQFPHTRETYAPSATSFLFLMFQFPHTRETFEKDLANHAVVVSIPAHTGNIDAACEAIAEDVSIPAHTGNIDELAIDVPH